MGEEIEFLTGNGEWINAGGCPAWTCDQYRIKPKFEKRYKYAYFCLISDSWRVSEEYYVSDESFGKNGHSVFEKIEASGKDFQIN